MKNKKDVLIIDKDTEFVSQIEKTLEDEVNIISARTLEVALTYCDFDKNIDSSEIGIEPDLIVIGDVSEIPEKLKNKIKEDLPEAYDEKALNTFLPMFYCKLLQKAFQKDRLIKPKVCICADLEQYSFDGSQDITRKLSYCMQYGIPIMHRHERNKDLMLTTLENLICNRCGIENDKSYR